MIKYLGSKRLLIPRILELVRSLSVRTVADLFCGTARVAHAFKRAGYLVTANDHNRYAHALARCYVQADQAVLQRDAEALIAHLNNVPPRAGYVTETFCERSRFFQPENGARIDAIRDEIVRLQLPGDLEAIALVSLMEAADRVDSTCGVQMAYLKQWAARSYQPLTLRVPALAEGPGEAWNLDAADAAEQGEWDLAYLDPPYNQHKYRNNYHIWETLIRWDAPEVYGRACKREDCREYRSLFNSGRTIAHALEDLIRRVRARYLVVSFSSEGLLPVDAVRAILERHGELMAWQAFDSKRYVGAQIGVYSPSGEKVGKVSHLRNKEHLFVLDRDARQRSFPELSKPRLSATEFVGSSQ